MSGRFERQLKQARDVVGRIEDQVRKLDARSGLDEHEALFHVLDSLRGAGQQQGGPTDKELTEFCRWFEDRGGKLHGVRPRSGIAGMGTGMVSTADISAGDVVIEVPWAAMMTEETAAATAKEAVGEETARRIPELALEVLLVHEHCSLRSPWEPYLRALPRTYGTPLFWTWGELAELRGSPALRECLACLRTTAAQYCRLFRDLDAAAPGARWVSLPAFTFSEFAWAVSVVMTRKNRVPRTHGGGGDMVALIPMWDMCNHEVGRITTDAGPAGSRCTAMRPFARGEQFFIHYGDRPNHQLFSHNGFVIAAGTPFDIVPIAAPQPDPAKDPKRAAIVSSLLPPGTLHTSVFVDAQGQPSPHLQAALRASSLSPEELAAFKQGETDLQTAAVSAENDKCAGKLLADICAIALRAYPTTVHQDESVLSSGKPLSAISRSAIQLRIIEKRILALAITKNGGEVPAEEPIPAPAIHTPAPAAPATIPTGANATAPTKKAKKQKKKQQQQ